MKFISKVFKMPRIFFLNLKERKKTGNYTTDYLNNYTENYPKNYPKNHPKYNQRNRKKNNWNMFRRILVAFAIFLVVLMIRETNHPVGVQTREGLEYMLTTEWNFQPTLDKAVQLGLQTVNMDVPFFNDLPGTSPVLSPRLSNEYAMPVSGKIIKPYGWVKDSAEGLEYFNAGIYISCAPGTVVKASRSGRVVRVGEDKVQGTYVLLDHGKGDFTLYAGLGEVFVKENYQVEAKTQIAIVGEREGSITGLHFEIRENNKLVDPLARFTNFTN